MNNIQDNQYLALELTKILFSDKQGLNVANISQCYSSILKEITNTADEINTISNLKNEINKLQKENERLKQNNRGNLELLIKDIITIVEGCKGDMEPYVYESLISNCKRYEK